MADSNEPRRPTDHLPPAEERDPDDERTTGDALHPDDGPPDATGGVSETTAAEPDAPARHGVAKLPPGPH